MQTRKAQRKLDAIALKGGRCCDCGEEFIGRPEVFDFDHLGDKTGNMATLLQSATWARVLQELDKCELVCSNCHRTRTRTRGGTP